jgi:hypothetical protein
MEQASEAMKKVQETVSQFLETTNMPASIPQVTDKVEVKEPAPLEMKKNLTAGNAAVEHEAVGQESTAKATKEDPKSEVLLEYDNLKEDLVLSTAKKANNKEALEEEVADNHMDDIDGETQEEDEIGADPHLSGVEETSSHYEYHFTSREVPDKVFPKESVTYPTLLDVETVLKVNEELLKQLRPPQPIEVFY